MVTEAGRRAFGESTHITEATLRARDVIYTGLLRRGIAEDVAREAANNLSMSVIEALRQLAEESKPPPIRRPCEVKPWCGLANGHPGICEYPPF